MSTKCLPILSCDLTINLLTPQIKCCTCSMTDISFSRDQAFSLYEWKFVVMAVANKFNHFFIGKASLTYDQVLLISLCKINWCFIFIFRISTCTKLVDGLRLGTTLSPRSRLPPPGFTSTPNHMNAFGLGIPRTGE